MKPKTGNPIGNQHRPIALTNVGYKIFMGLVKNKTVDHLERNGLISDYQAGLKDNLFIIRYCIKETYRLAKRLVVNLW